MIRLKLQTGFALRLEDATKDEAMKVQALMFVTPLLQGHAISVELPCAVAEFCSAELRAVWQTLRPVPSYMHNRFLKIYPPP